MQENKPKLCYILQYFDENDDSHFYHIYGALAELAKEFDIYLILEKAKGVPNIENIGKVYVQKRSFLAFRAMEIFFVCLKARKAGYENFYVHYSRVGALCAAWARCKVYYWNCGLPWLYEKGLSRFISKLIYRKISFLVTGNETMRNLYAQNYGIDLKKIKTAPNWIDLKRFDSYADKKSLREKKNLPIDKKILLFVHTLSKRKGADLIPVLFKQLDEIGFDGLILVIGDGPEKQRLSQVIETNNLNNRIKMLGGVSNREIADYYLLADMFVMPSREEGVPRVLIEAMAAGLPYVASNVGGVGEMGSAGAKKYLFQAGDMTAAASKIINLFEEKNYKEFVEAGKEKVMAYSTVEYIDNFKKIFV